MTIAVALLLDPVVVIVGWLVAIAGVLGTTAAGLVVMTVPHQTQGADCGPAALRNALMTVRRRHPAAGRHPVRAGQRRDLRGHRNLGHAVLSGPLPRVLTASR